MSLWIKHLFPAIIYVVLGGKKHNVFPLKSSLFMFLLKVVSYTESTKG